MLENIVRLVMDECVDEYSGTDKNKHDVEHPTILIYENGRDDCAIWEFITMVKPSTLEFFNPETDRLVESLTVSKNIDAFTSFVPGFLDSDCWFSFSGKKIQNLVIVINHQLASKMSFKITDCFEFVVGGVQSHMLARVAAGEVIVFDLHTKTILKKI